MAKPTSELVYLKKNGQLVLGYVNTFDLTEPSGSWQQILDAKSGEVLETNRLDIPKKPTELYQLAKANKLQPFEQKRNSMLQDKLR